MRILGDFKWPRSSPAGQIVAKSWAIPGDQALLDNVRARIGEHSREVCGLFSGDDNDGLHVGRLNAIVDERGDTTSQQAVRVFYQTQIEWSNRGLGRWLQRAVDAVSYIGGLQWRAIAKFQSRFEVKSPGYVIGSQFPALG